MSFRIPSIPLPVKYSEYNHKWGVDSSGSNRLMDIATPFLKLSKKTSLYAEAIQAGREVYKDIKQIFKAYNEPTHVEQYVVTKRTATTTYAEKRMVRVERKESLPLSALKLAATVSLIGLTIINKNAGNIADTSLNMALYAKSTVQSAQKGEYKKATEAFVKTAGCGCYLGVILGGGIQLKTVALALRAGLGLYGSYKELSNTKEDKTIEGLAKLVLTGFYAYDLKQAASELWDSYKGVRP